MHACTQCAKTFGLACRQRQHFARKHVKAQFPCERCDKVLRSRDALRRHQQSHDGVFQYGKCLRCGAGFRSAARRDRHACRATEARRCDQCQRTFATCWACKRHSLAHGGVYAAGQCPCCRTGFGSAARREHHACARRDAAEQAAADAMQVAAAAAATPPLEACVEPTQSGRQGRARTCAVCKRHAADWFDCGPCGKVFHGSCGAGVPTAALLPTARCRECLRAEVGAAPDVGLTTVGVAALGRVGAVAFADELGLDVKPIAADGRCLLTAVHAVVATGKTKGVLFADAVAAIADEARPLAYVKALRHVDVEAASAAVHHAQLLAGTRLATAAGAGAWDAELDDCMPAALSRVVGRRLVVVSGHWSTAEGRVHVDVIDERSSGERPRSDDVFLVRSGDEYGVPHYDACVSRH